MQAVTDAATEAPSPLEGAAPASTEPARGAPKVSIRRVLDLARPELKNLAFATVFLVLGSGATLLYPQAVRVILDEAQATGDQHLVDRASLAMVAIFLVQGVAISLRFILFTLVGERIVVGLRKRLYRAILDQEVAFFDSRRTGELMNRLASDTTVLQNTVSVNVSMALRSAATVLGGVVFLFYTSPLLASLMLLVVPPVSLGAVYYGRRLRRLAREVQDALAKASEVAQETLSGIRTVRAFAAEATETARYDASVQESYRLARKRIVLSGTFIGLTSMAGFAAMVLVLWFGGSLVVEGSMTVGELTAFFVYIVLVAASLGALSNLWVDFMKASGAASRVFELLDRVTEMPSGVGLTPAQVVGHVRFDRVSFRYPTRPDVLVLKNVSLEIQPGKVLALVGPSGSGKSTIASLLGRLYDPEAGQVLLDGVPLTSLDSDWFRRQVGVVSQEPTLFSTTLRENIRYGRPEADDEAVEAAARAANADGFIGGFPDGYDTEVGERGVQLSGGQKQRVAIARALLKDPKILILDEATSALDSESEHLVKQALDRLMVGRASLVIAHRLSTVADADEVVVLEAGQVVERGGHHELLGRHGLYRQLVERQFVSA